MFHSRPAGRTFCAFVSLTTLVMLFAAGCPGRVPPGTQQAAFALLEPSVSVPVTLVGSQIFVDCWINGEGPFVFMLDTGSSGTLVSEALAARFPQLLVPTNRSIADTDGNVLPVHRALRIDQLTLGAAEVRDLYADVFALRSLGDAYGTPLDGILGYPLFADVRLTIDYNGQSLHMDSLDGQSAVVAGEQINLEQTGGRPYVTIAINNTPLSALVDSGNTLTLHLPGDLDGLALAAGPRPWFTGTDLSGEEQPSVARLAGTVRVGSHTLESPIVILGATREPIVGGAFLRNFTVTFDQRAGQLALNATGEIQYPSAAIRTFGLRHTWTDGQLVVTGLLPGGPADGRLRPGDAIAEINGTSLEALASLSVWLRDFFVASSLNPKQPRVELAISRGGEAFTVILESVVWIP
jgi:hypothetical protein